MSLAKKQSCLLLRNGIEFWIDDDKRSKLEDVLLNSQLRFITYEDKLINIADITGIFSPTDMENMNRKKNGQWKCQLAGVWHDKFTKCECEDPRKYVERIEESINKGIPLHKDVVPKYNKYCQLINKTPLAYKIF